MILDVFNDDAFKLLPLSDALSNRPRTPTKIGDRGFFEENGITTLEVGIEMVNGVITLVPAQPRGGPAVVKGLQPRNVRKLGATHLPQRTALYADEVVGLRAFGSETEVAVAQARLMEKLDVCKTDNDVTLEWQRMGAIKGKVLDSDGTSVIMDLFGEFGVTQQTLNFNLDVTTTNVRKKCVDAKRLMEAALGAVSFAGAEAIASPEFMDALVDHENVKRAYEQHSAAMAQFTEDMREAFRYGGIDFWEYNGQVGAQRMVEAGCAYLVPRGVPRMLRTHFSPANTMDAIGTRGLPYYVSLERLPHDVGIEAFVQSNPLHINSRPNAVIKLGLNAAALA